MEISLCNSQGQPLQEAETVYTCYRFRNSGGERCLIQLIQAVGGVPFKTDEFFAYFLIEGDHLHVMRQFV